MNPYEQSLMNASLSPAARFAACADWSFNLHGNMVY